MPNPAPTTRRPLEVYESHELVKLETWVQLARTFYLIERRIVALLGGRGLTLPQFDVLATLRFSGGCNQQELAQRLLVTKGNVCGILDRLETMGWVQRRADGADRRSNRLYLTDRGKRKIESVLPEHDKLVLAAMRALSGGAARSLRGLLDELAQTNDQPA